MNTELSALESIKSEVSTDDNGVGYFSQSAVARLCGVKAHAINKHLSTNGSKFIRTLDLPNSTPINKLSDITTMKFIEYYAFESKARNNTALNNFRAFASVGLRVLAQEVSGYKAAQARIFDKEYQKLQMAKIKLIEDDNAAYTKANTITNKAVSNYFGFPKMLKKDEMNQPMLNKRQEILEDCIKLMQVMGVETGSGVKEIIYNKYQQKLLVA